MSANDRFVSALDPAGMVSLFRAAADRCRELSLGDHVRFAAEAEALREAGELSSDIAADLAGALAALEEAAGFSAILDARKGQHP